MTSSQVIAALVVLGAVTRFEKNSPTPPVTSKVFEVETPAGRCEVGARDVFEAKTLAAEAAGCTYDDVQLISIAELPQTPTNKES